MSPRMASRSRPRIQAPCPFAAVGLRSPKHQADRCTRAARECRQARSRVEQPDRLSAPPFQLRCGSPEAMPQSIRCAVTIFPLVPPQAVVIVADGYASYPRACALLPGPLGADARPRATALGQVDRDRGGRAALSRSYPPDAWIASAMPRSRTSREHTSGS